MSSFAVQQFVADQRFDKAEVRRVFKKACDGGDMMGCF